MLNLNNFKILNPSMPDKETETETLHQEGVVVEVTVNLSLLTRCQLLVLIEMTRGATPPMSPTTSPSRRRSVKRTTGRVASSNT